VIDANAGNDAASQAARLILMASLAEANDAVKGLSEDSIRAFLIAPGRSEGDIIAGFDALVQRSSSAATTTASPASRRRSAPPTPSRR